jgi:hypothetical protein
MDPANGLTIYWFLQLNRCPHFKAQNIMDGLSINRTKSVISLYSTEALKRKVMDIQAEKLYLIEQLEKVQDVEVIRQLKKILGQENESVVGYRVSGEPISQKQLVKRVEDAESRIEAGHFTTQQDLEREAESW